MKKEFRTPIAVFASGRGSNFAAICTAIRENKLQAKIVALVCNVPQAPVCKLSEQFDVPLVVVSHANKSRPHHEKEVLEKLAPLNPQWIVLAGYMRLLSPDFIKRFYDEKLGCSKIVNVHPSLLPSFPGTDAYGQAIRHGVKLTGVTVHLVDEGLDEGPIVAQRAFEVLDEDTEESLSRRGLALEHDVYSQALNDLMTRPFRVTRGTNSNGRPRVEFLK